jgi:hypothetical protein
MGSPRVTSRPPAPSRGGGGTGTGTGGAIVGAKYVGTLGRATEALAGAKYPHNLQFPAANKGDWLSVVSSYQVADQDPTRTFDVESGEIWVCNADKTIAENPANWERVIRSQKPDIFECVGFYFIGRYDFHPLPSGDKDTIRTLDFSDGSPSVNLLSYYLGDAPTPIATRRYVDINPWKEYFELRGLRLYLDVDVAVYFGNDATGDRMASLDYAALKLENGITTEISSGWLDKKIVSTSLSFESCVRPKLIKRRISFDVAPNPQDVLIHAIYISGYQNSGIPLNIRKMTMTMSAYKVVQNGQP